MSNPPILCVSWDIGKDKHGRRVVLHQRNGQFDVVAEPVNQRDDGEKMYSLTLENLKSIGAVAAQIRGT